MKLGSFHAVSTRILGLMFRNDMNTTHKVPEKNSFFSGTRLLAYARRIRAYVGVLLDGEAQATAA